MFILYDFIFLIFAIIYLPIYLFKGKLNHGFLNRFGFLSPGLGSDRPIWVHAVSVGEAILVRGLINELRLKYPGKRIIISTVTVTGNKIAKSIAIKNDLVVYLPLDFSFIVRKVIDKINPSVFIIAETEIWPNLISYLYKKKIPIITVNGRISDSSLKGYSVIKFLIKPILNKISLFCVQTQLDKERLLMLGANGERIKVTGNMKFDIIDREPKFKYSRETFGLSSDKKLLVLGSSHRGEERIILDSYKELLIEFPNLRLVIAPRHPERAKEVAGLVSLYGFTPVLISKPSLISQIKEAIAVFILDTVGELKSFYAMADIVFVGGSLVRKGGQNILEPASLGKPVIFGPHMFNFREIVQLFLNKKAAIMVNDSEELKIKIKELLVNPKIGISLVEASRGVLSDNQGATERNIRLINV